MNIQKLLVALLLCGATALSNSCRKIDKNPLSQQKTDRFFNNQNNLKPEVLQVIEEIKKQNNLTQLVNQLVNRAGYPIWEKARTITSSVLLSRNEIDNQQDTITIIPLVKDNTQIVDSYLAAKINGQITLKLFESKEVTELLNVHDQTNANKYALLFMNLTKETFGTKRFRVTNETLFAEFRNNSNEIIEVILPDYQATSRMAQLCVTITIATTSQFCGTPGFHGCASQCDNCGTYCYPKTTYQFAEICNDWWVPDSGGGGTSVGDDGSGGTSSGGNNNVDFNPCLTLGSVIVDGRIAEICNDIPQNWPGWVPILEETNIPASDSLVIARLNKISNAISDSSNSLFNKANNRAMNKEWGFLIVSQSDSIYPKNTKGGLYENYTPFDYTIRPTEKLLGTLHVHQSGTDNPKDRPSFSGDDVNVLRKFINHDPPFVLLIECGNVRYALIIESIDKARIFFATYNSEKLRTAGMGAYQLSGAYNDWQLATETAIKNLLNTSANTGIGFYKSNLAKDNFSKLN